MVMYAFYTLKVMCVSPASLSSAGCGLSPLKVCELVAAKVAPLLGDLEGPVRGQAYVQDIRGLCSAAKDVILAEAAASTSASSTSASAVDAT